MIAQRLKPEDDCDSQLLAGCKNLSDDAPEPSSASPDETLAVTSGQGG
jgi:hypothetical protein